MHFLSFVPWLIPRNLGRGVSFIKCLDLHVTCKQIFLFSRNPLISLFLHVYQSFSVLLNILSAHICFQNKHILLSPFFYTIDVVGAGFCCEYTHLSHFEYDDRDRRLIAVRLII